MINPHGNYWIPSPGYKYISDGDVWTDGMYLGTSDNIVNWHDTNDEPPEPPAPHQEPTEDELARSAVYLFDNNMVELPEQEQPDYLHEHEPEPEYFN